MYGKYLSVSALERRAPTFPHTNPYMKQPAQFLNCVFLWPPLDVESQQRKYLINLQQAHNLSEKQLQAPHFHLYKTDSILGTVTTFLPRRDLPEGGFITWVALQLCPEGSREHFLYFLHYLITLTTPSSSRGFGRPGLLSWDRVTIGLAFHLCTNRIKTKQKQKNNLIQAIFEPFLVIFFIIHIH